MKISTASTPQTTPFKYKTDSVLNLSSRVLTETELRVLALGFNFRPSLPDLPIKDYIVATEAYIKSNNLDESSAAALRNTIVNELLKMKERQVRRASKTNLTPGEWKAIKSLRSDNSIMIISADKGNKTVILDKDLYLAKLRDRTSAHNLTNSDPAIAHEDALNAAIDIIITSTLNI